MSIFPRSPRGGHGSGSHGGSDSGSGSSGSSGSSYGSSGYSSGYSSYGSSSDSSSGSDDGDYTSTSPYTGNCDTSVAPSDFYADQATYLNANFGLEIVTFIACLATLVAALRSAHLSGWGRWVKAGIVLLTL